MPVKWEDNSSEVMDKLIKDLYRNMNLVGLHLKKRTQENIATGAAGQVVGGTRPRHPEPGGFPRRDTGQLIRSIDYRMNDLVDRLVVTIGAHTEYARALELGGSPRMKWPSGLKFPFLRRTVDEEKVKVISLISKGLF